MYNEQQNNQKEIKFPFTSETVDLAGRILESLRGQETKFLTFFSPQGILESLLCSRYYLAFQKFSDILF